MIKITLHTLALCLFFWVSPICRSYLSAFSVGSSNRRRRCWMSNSDWMPGPMMSSVSEELDDREGVKGGLDLGLNT